MILNNAPQMYFRVKIKKTINETIQKYTRKK